MDQTTSHHRGPRKLHGTFTLTRLTGAGVELRDTSTADDPERVSLYFGDGATNVAILGSLDEVHQLVTEADHQLTELGRHRLHQEARG